MSDEITVEVVCALPDVQSITSVAVPNGARLTEALAVSGVLDHPQLRSRSDLSFGIWGQLVASDYCLQDGDRIEIYRPLKIDPREARRKLADAGRTMGAKPD